MRKYPTYGESFEKLYQEFMLASQKGTRLKNRMKAVSKSTLKGQRFLLDLILEFSNAQKIHLKIRVQPGYSAQIDPYIPL